MNIKALARTHLAKTGVPCITCSAICPWKWEFVFVPFALWCWNRGQEGKMLILPAYLPLLLTPFQVFLWLSPHISTNDISCVLATVQEHPLCQLMHGSLMRKSCSFHPQFITRGPDYSIGLKQVFPLIWLRPGRWIQRSMYTSVLSVKAYTINGKRRHKYSKKHLPNTGYPCSPF